MSKENYIDKVVVSEQLKNYSDRFKENEKLDIPAPIVPDDLAVSLLKMANKVGYKYRFRDYTYVDEMISDAIIICLKYMHRFDSKFGNTGFNYLTTLIHNAFFNRINIERKQQYIRSKEFVGCYEQNISSFVADHAVGNDPSEVYKDSISFVTKYEQQMEEAKLKKKNKNKCDVFDEFERDFV